MPIFRFLSLENETPSLVFETQKRLVFLGLIFATGQNREVMISRRLGAAKS